MGRRGCGATARALTTDGGMRGAKCLQQCFTHTRCFHHLTCTCTCRCLLRRPTLRGTANINDSSSPLASTCSYKCRTGNVACSPCSHVPMLPPSGSCELSCASREVCEAGTRQRVRARTGSRRVSLPPRSSPPVSPLFSPASRCFHQHPMPPPTCGGGGGRTSARAVSPSQPLDPRSPPCSLHAFRLSSWMF